MAKRRIPMPPPTRKRPGKRYTPTVEIDWDDAEPSASVPDRVPEEFEIEFEIDPDLDVDPVEALEVLQDLGLLGPNVKVRRGCKYED